jgi:hypothetical protein
MMRNIIFRCIIACAFVTTCFAESMTRISYEAKDFSDGRWEYTYETTNLDLSIDGQPVAIKEFTIWFDSGLYTNLVVTTPAPLSNAWNEIVWQPEPVLQDPGAYDALALVSNPGIATGQSARGFSVSFEWLGQGTPGSQRYEIINPDTFETVDAGLTIPEPATLLLLAVGGLLIRKNN